MLATTVVRTATGNTALLPMGLLIANASLTSGSNLAGFFLFSLLGTRNELLLAKAHKNELKAEKAALQRKLDDAVSELEDKDQQIATLTEQISLQKTLEAAPPISSSEQSFTITTGLFGRRLSASTRSELPLAQQQAACSVLTNETGASTGNEPAIKR